jgi:hypothetical protein
MLLTRHISWSLELLSKRRASAPAPHDNDIFVSEQELAHFFYGCRLWQNRLDYSSLSA